MSNKSSDLQKKEERAEYLLKKSGIYSILHVIILLLSIFLVVCISIDTFHNEAFYEVPRFMKVQLWICVVFLADFFIEFFISPNKKYYLSTHFIFFLVSIPYNAIISHYGWTFSPIITYLIRYIPLIRGGYAMAIVVSWFTYNKATGLFISYLVTLLFTIYFSSLAFFLFEHGPNPLVKTYTDALWWASMDATTVGSNIVAVTPVGRVLSVLLAAIGMMMFPIFTVYITNLLTKQHQAGLQNPSDITGTEDLDAHPSSSAGSSAPATGQSAPVTQSSATATGQSAPVTQSSATASDASQK